MTRETLATVQGLLPLQAVRQALHQVGQEVQAEGRQIQLELDLAEIRRQVLAQPANSSYGKDGDDFVLRGTEPQQAR